MRKPVFNLLKNLFKPQPDYPELLGRYNALQNKHEKLLAENSALHRRLAEYEGGHETVPTTKDETSLSFEHKAAPSEGVQ
jgi:hypothetical protein